MGPRTPAVGRRLVAASEHPYLVALGPNELQRKRMKRLAADHDDQRLNRVLTWALKGLSKSVQLSDLRAICGAVIQGSKWDY